VQIIAHTSGIIRDKVQIMEDIKTLNASKQYEQKVMNLIPFVIIIYMNLSSPDFFRTLYTQTLGRVTMTVCLLLYCLSIYLANRIMDIEV
jgi:tight adherence protein B